MRAAAQRALLAALILAACGRDPDLAGGGTDTETGGAKAFGRLSLAGGGPAACAVIEMRPAGFLRDPLESVPAAGRRVSADAQGRFRFDSIPPGSWRFEARCGDSLFAVLDGAFADTAARLEFPPAVLRAPGRITGRIRYADGARRPSLTRVHGLPLMAMSDTAGSFELARVPAGTHAIRFSCLLPFLDSADRAGVRVVPDSATDLGEIVLGRRVKQGFRLADGKLLLDGFGPGNPIILDNDRFDNTADDEFLWALASAGRADLRGLILPGRPEGRDAWRAFHQASLRELETARRSGLRGIPDPLPGADAKLALPASGRWEETAPVHSPGSDLIAAVAAKATPERPLIVFAGGPMTTVASAVLAEPRLADRILVFATFNFNRPDEDSLAVFIAARRCRLVEWGSGYTWDPALPRAPGAWPPGRYGEAMRDRYATAAPFGFFGDLSGAALLFDPSLMNAALPMSLPAPGAQASAAALEASDFLDIPSGATSFAGIRDAFFAAMAADPAWHPWGPGDTIQAEAYARRAPDDSGFRVDSTGEQGSEAIHGLSAGKWAEWRVRGPAGEYELQIRCRMPPGGWFEAGRSGDTATRHDIPTAPYYNNRVQRVRLTGAIDTLRIAAGTDSLDLDWLRLRAP